MRGIDRVLLLHVELFSAVLVSFPLIDVSYRLSTLTSLASQVVLRGVVVGDFHAGRLTVPGHPS